MLYDTTKMLKFHSLKNPWTFENFFQRISRFLNSLQLAIKSSASLHLHVSSKFLLSLINITETKNPSPA